MQCDGKKLRLPRKIQGVVVLNIPSYMAGTNFWGTDREKDVSYLIISVTLYSNNFTVRVTVHLPLMTDLLKWLL